MRLTKKEGGRRLTPSICLWDEVRSSEEGIGGGEFVFGDMDEFVVEVGKG